MGAAMRGRGLSLQLALFAGAGLAILAGASFNIQGYRGETALLAILAGVAAWTGGLLYRQWKIAVSLGLIAIAFTAIEVHFAPLAFFAINTAGLLLLGLGGVLSTIAYEHVTEAMRTRVREVEALNRELQEQHRMFLAATEDPGINFSDLATLSATTARQVGAEFCIYYLATAEGFVNVFRQIDADHYEAAGKVATGNRAKIGLLVPELQRYYVVSSNKGAVPAQLFIFEVGK